MVHLYIGDFPYQTDRLPEGTWIFPIFWQVLSRDYHPTARTGTCRLAVENNGKIWCWLVQRGWIFHFGRWNRHNKPTFCLVKHGQPSILVAQPLQELFFWTPKVIKLSFFIREDRVSCELLGVSLQDQRVARRLGLWQFQLFFYRAVWTWAHQKRHSLKTFGASKHIILVTHQICKGMINPKKDDTPSNLWYSGLLSDPYRDEMRDDSWRMAEFELSSKPALASLKATGERKQSRSRLQVAHWEGMGKTLQEGPQDAPSRNVKRQRQAVWSLKALGSLTDPAGCCMLMGTFEYTEPLMACTSFRGAMAALGAYFRRPSSSSKAGPGIWFTLWYSNIAMGNRLQIWKFSWGIPL